jgi:hypothetical protein
LRRPERWTRSAPRGGPAHRIRLAASALLALALAIAGKAHAAAPPRTDERDVKAAVLCNLPKFVTWPARPVEDPRPAEDPLAPLVIGIVEPDPFGTTLDRLAASTRAGGRPLAVRRLERPDPRLHVLFVPGGTRDTRELLAGAGPGVLTVGESADFLEQGGMVRLAVVDGHVRFQIDPAAAARAGLTVSSQLLRLAGASPLPRRAAAP